MNKDYLRYFNKKPVGFSPEWNKHVIDTTIKEYEDNRKRRAKEFNDQIRERAEAVASYLEYLDRGYVSSVEKYFGKKVLAHLRGEDVINQIKGSGKQIISNLNK